MHGVRDDSYLHVVLQSVSYGKKNSLLCLLQYNVVRVVEEAQTELREFKVEVPGGNGPKYIAISSKWSINL